MRRTADNIHQVAQRVAPESKIVYVDNDPVVLAHARALLVGTPEGVTRYLDEDLYEPQKIVLEARKVLDFDQPVALMLMGILGHVSDWAQAKDIVRELVSALPSGSYLTTCDSTNVHDPEAMNRAASIYNSAAKPLIHLRPPWHFTELVTELGSEAVPPGAVPVTQWEFPRSSVFRGRSRSTSTGSSRESPELRERVVSAPSERPAGCHRRRPFE
jgi:hypothetical protein